MQQSCPKSCVVFVDDPPVWGGGQLMLRHYLDFTQSVARCVLIRPRAGREPDNRWTGSTLYRIPFPQYPAGMARLTTQLRMAPSLLACAARLRRIIRREQANAVFCNSFFGLLPLYLANRLPRCPLIAAAHTTDIPNNRFSRRLFQYCNRVLCCSAAAARALTACPDEKKTIVLNGISFPSSVVPDTSFRRQFSWDSRWVLIYTGRFTPGKNLEALIRAFGIFSTETPPDSRRPALLLVGDGPEVARIKQVIKNLGLGTEVAFTGFQRDIAPILADGDAFCLPSLDEALPISIMEAQLLGLPVMGTPVGGIPELLQDGATGILAPSTTVEGLLNGLRRLRNVERNSGMVMSAKKQIESRFNLHQQEAAFLHLLKGVLP